MAILRNPFCTDFLPFIYNKPSDDGSEAFQTIKTQGSFLYKNEYPVIILEENPTTDWLFNRKLLTEIPDSLQFAVGKHNVHHKKNNPLIIHLIKGIVVTI